jgi:hypothetical protein
MPVDIGFLGTQAGEESGTLWHGDAIEAEAAFVGSVQAWGLPAAVREAEGDAGTLIVSLERRSKKHRAAAAVRHARAGTTADTGKSATWVAADTGLS